jgi:hypothetical protein
VLEHLKTVLLIGSLLLNIGLIGFLVVLHFTPYLDVPLAAYSHQKNCERDFDQVIKMGDKLPEQQRTQAKQLYATLVCQKDYQTGRALADTDFTRMFEQFKGQLPADAQVSIPASQ